MTWRRILPITRLSHRILHRMPFELADPPGGRCLVIGASVERAMLGCGGSLLRRRSQGAPDAAVPQLFVGGGSSDLAAEFGGRVPDGDRADACAAQLESGVEVAFVPFVGTAAEAEREMLAEFDQALRRAPAWGGEVWMYETTLPLWPNRGVDVSEVSPMKREFLERFGVDKGQLEAVFGLNRYRGLRPVVPRVEAYLALSRRAFAKERERWS